MQNEFSVIDVQAFRAQNVDSDGYPIAAVVRTGLRAAQLITIENLYSIKSLRIKSHN